VGPFLVTLNKGCDRAPITLFEWRDGMKDTKELDYELDDRLELIAFTVALDPDFGYCIPQYALFE